MHEATLHLTELPGTPMATVRWMNQNGSALHAETFSAGGIAGTSLPVRSLTVLLEVRRVVGVDDRLVSDWNVREFAIFAASVQAVFPGHEVVVVTTTSRKEEDRAIVLVAVEVPSGLRIPTVARFRFQEAQFGYPIKSIARRKIVSTGDLLDGFNPVARIIPIECHQPIVVVASNGFVVILVIVVIVHGWAPPGQVVVDEALVVHLGVQGSVQWHTGSHLASEATRHTARTPFGPL